MKEIEWQEGGPILLKPTISASQAKFVALAESDQELQVQLSSVCCLAAKRKAGQGSFKLELFIYVSRIAASTTIRRATEGRIATAATLINEPLTSHPEGEQLGEASQAYWAVTHARQPDQTPLTIPTNPTFTQLQRIDAYQREADNESLQRAVSPEFVNHQEAAQAHRRRNRQHEHRCFVQYHRRPPHDWSAMRSLWCS
ncbi:hypothetical protein PR001_g7463 [Phytophthora rubi]|uniref:Uncharacterized protein n=1 Tax=Phytophthora rubi TaxID=129364 RepID=A0A6A3ND85_9STRA|nr:hypothetical protein PR001_g7463 [Phytophthora rubi]